VTVHLSTPSTLVAFFLRLAASWSGMEDMEVLDFLLPPPWRFLRASAIAAFFYSSVSSTAGSSFFSSAALAFFLFFFF